MNDSKKPPEKEFSGPPGGKKSLLSDLGERSLDYLGDRFKRFVDDAREQLVEEAEKAGSNLDQSAYFETFTILRKNADKVVRNLSAAVKRHLADFRDLEFAIPGGEKANSDELALVDEEEFELWLAESEAASAAESRFHPDLHALEARLSVLRDQRVDSRNNPVGPRALAHHAIQILKDLLLPHATIPVVMKSFGSIVLLQNGKLYTRLNEMMIAQGVLPDLSLKVKRSKKTPRKKTPATPKPDETAPQSGDREPTSAGDKAGEAKTATSTATAGDSPAPAARRGAAATVIDIRDILKRRGVMGGKPPYSGDPSQVKPLNLQELDEALGELEGQASEFAGQRLQKRLAEAVTKRFGKDGERRLEPEHEDAVFLTDELLTAITGDAIVSELGKQWIQKLELPLLRLLLKDESLVEDPEHPGRRLLNHLGQVHWPPGATLSPRDQETMKRIDSLVSELSAHKEFEGHELDAAATELESLLKRDQRRRETNTRRVVETAEGQQKLETARNQVERMLAERLAGQRVPKILVDLLEAGWRDLLTLATLRSGPESPEVSSTVSVIDQLRSRIESGEADEDGDARLIDQVRERLENSGADPGAQREVINRLEALLGEGETPETVDMPEPEPERELEEEEAPDPDASFWLGRAKLLDVGSWMLYPDETGRVCPVKLAWISEDRTKYVFVGRDGQKALEIGPDELASRLKTEEADIADHRDEPLMDRSWQGIVQRMHDQIAHQATHDELTELLNRSEFERRLKLKVSESKLIENTHIAMLVDIDQFRIINTTAGHEAGDRLLQDIAELLQETVPEQAEIARVGADEFAILVPRCLPEQGHELASGIRKAIAAHNTSWMTRRLRATVSIGVVGIDRDTGDLGELFQRLEVACDAAKEEGDRVRSFEIGDKDLSRRDEALQRVAELERAIDGGRLVLFGQRIQPIDGPDESGGHFEVLTRIRDEDGNLCEPSEFVLASESYGRIHFLDEAVLKQACELLAASPLKSEIKRLSINISGKTFGRPRFVELVADLLDEHNVHPSSICIEITESAAMSNLSRCADVLRDLRYMGCKFSLDDFGTGLSSFSYLKHLPVDYLKIDGSFIRELTESSADYGLVRTINEMAHLLGKKTVAEFVETNEILDALKQIGIDYVQGYAVEEPRPLDKILPP